MQMTSRAYKYINFLARLPYSDGMDTNDNL